MERSVVFSLNVFVSFFLFCFVLLVYRFKFNFKEPMEHL